MGHNVCYVWDENLINQCNRIPAVLGRASMVHDLLLSYDLLQQTKVIRSSPATYEELKIFHSEIYINHLKNFKEIDEDYLCTNQDEEYGIGYECPPVSNMFELVSVVAGGSITAAKSLILGMGDIAINWCGGWHHAQRFGAEGFCYVNDIVLAIETLRTKFTKVLYIDLDVHHGNGVQDAYNLSKSVFTLSFHKYEPGFYPGSGGLNDIGTLAGKGYSCNFPLKAWYSDETMEYVFERVFTPVFNQFGPGAVVVQCGADALARDARGGAGLSPRAYARCLAPVLARRLPTLLLGGGGYNHANTARLWTMLTAQVLGVTLDEDIPEHDHWTKYGPSYTLPVEATLARDSNQKQYLDQCVSTIRENLHKYMEIVDDQEPVLKKRKIYDNTVAVSNQELKKCDKIDSIDFRKVRIGSDTSKSKVLSTKTDASESKSLDVYDFAD